MGRKKKPRRRDVYFIAFSFPNGAAFACGPERKPSTKRIKEDSLYIDDDFVFRETKYGSTEWHSWSPEHRRELSQIMAIRLNSRRALRELVLPELKIIQVSLNALDSKLNEIARRLDTEQAKSP